MTTRTMHLCPDCKTEMIWSGEGYLMHAESTDCSPAPWPDLLSVRTVLVDADG